MPTTSDGDSEVEHEVEQQISAIVQGDDLRVLRLVVLDPHGMPEEAAPSYVASNTGLRMEVALQILLGLMGRQLIVRVEDERGPCLIGNMPTLGISEATRLRILLRASPFKRIGAPHSPLGLESLKELFLSGPGPIYLGLEATDPAVFSALDERARASRPTVFLMPRRSGVPFQKQLHYREMREKWRNFVSETKQRRTWIDVRVTTRPHPAIYTSALSKQIARLDLYSFQAMSTREGEMVEVGAGSSLYRLVETEFQLAFSRSSPILRLAPLKWLREWAVRAAPIAVAIVAVLLAAESSVPLVGALGFLFLGIAGQAIWESVGSRTWAKRDLFPRS